jgi:hypothetical protein
MDRLMDALFDLTLEVRYVAGRVGRFFLIRDARLLRVRRESGARWSRVCLALS